MSEAHEPESLETQYARWLASHPNDSVFEFLKLHATESVRDQVNVLLKDQFQAWKSGRNTKVEAYLSHLPVLRQHHDLLLELIREEWGYQEDSGEAISLEAYQQRFPFLKDDIRRLMEESLGDRGNMPSASVRSDAIGDESTQLFNQSSEPAPPQKPRLSLPEIDKEIGPYLVIRKIGQGGMGVVYRARHQTLQRDTAIKLIRPGEHVNEEHRLRFQAEALAAAKLNHPGIVSIYDIGQHREFPYMAMEFVDGESLWERIRKSPLEPRDAAQVMALAAEAVHYAHQHRVIHRDIKPQNILLTKSGRPKVTDFGLAKVLDLDSDLTKTGEFLGTPSYMPPEQARGIGKAVNEGADIYSLGATLYCVLTGRPPFQAATFWETAQQVVNREPVSPRVLNPAIPFDLQTICLKCLQKSPRHRYASAQELADDLGRYLRNEPIQARPVSRMEQVWRWCFRNPVLAGWSSAAVIFLLTTTVISGLAYVREGAWLAKTEELDVQKQTVESQNQTLSHRLTRVQNDSAIQRYQALLPHASAQRQLLSPGWTWKDLDSLRKAAAIRPDGQADDVSKSLVAVCLSAVDIDPVPLWEIELLGQDVAFLDDQRIAVTHRKDLLAQRPTVHFLDVATGQELSQEKLSLDANWSILRNDVVELDRLIVASEGRWMIAHDSAGRVHRWDLASPGKERVTVDTRQRKLSLSLNGDQTKFLAWNSRTLQVWNVDPFELQIECHPGDARFDALLGSVNDAGFSPSGNGVVVASGAHDELLELDLNTLSQRRWSYPKLQLIAPSATGNQLIAWGNGRVKKVSRCSTTLIEDLPDSIDAGGESRPIQIQDARHLYNDGRLAIAYDPQLKTLFGWDLISLKLAFRFPVSNRKQEFVSFAVAPNRERLIFSCGQYVTAFRLRRPREIAPVCVSDGFPAGMRVPAGSQCVFTFCCKGDPPVPESLNEWDIFRLDSERAKSATPISSHYMDPQNARLWDVSDDGTMMVFTPASTPQQWSVVFQNLRDGSRRDFHFRDQSAFVSRRGGLKSLQFVHDRTLSVVGGGEAGTVDLASALPHCELFRPQFSSVEEAARLLKIQPDWNTLIQGSQWRVRASRARGGTRSAAVWLEATAVHDESRGQQRQIPSDADVTSLALTSQERHVLAGFQSGNLALYSLPQLDPVADNRHVLGVEVTAVALIDDLTPVSGHRDGTVVIWKVQGNRLAKILSFPVSGTVLALAGIPNQRKFLISVMGETGLRLCEIDLLKQAYRDLGFPAFL